MCVARSTHAIDIDAIVAKVLRGQATATRLVSSRSARRVCAGSRQAAAVRSGRGPGAAEGSRATRDGFAVTLDCVNVAYRAAVCQAITRHACAGRHPDASFQPWPTATFFPKLTQATTSFFEFGWSPPTDPWTMLNAIVHSYGVDGAGTFNGGRYSNPRLDQLIDAIRVEPDIARRRQLVGDALRDDACRPAADPALSPHADLGDASRGQRRAMAERHPRAALRATLPTRRQPTWRPSRTSLHDHRAICLSHGHPFRRGCAQARRRTSRSQQASKRPLIVTDRGIAPLPSACGIRRRPASARCCRVFRHLGQSGQEPGRLTASPRSQASRRSVIGLGGGAALDVAKAIALMAVHQGDVLQYAWDHPQVRPIEHALPYFVALPTTAGTGSEVGRSSVISDDATHIKKIIFSPRAARQGGVRRSRADARPAAGDHRGDGDGRADPQRRVVPVSGLPPDVRRHCARRRCASRRRSLRTAVREPHNLQARSDMMMSSMMGAIAFQKDLGAVHSCAHALSTVADLHHGLANGIMIDHVMRFNLQSRAGKNGRAGARRRRRRDAARCRKRMPKPSSTGWRH